jgi:hypothetical protein
MAKESEDRFLEQIDAEIRSVNDKLKKVLGNAEALLREYSDEGPETTSPVSGDAKDNAEECETIDEGENEPDPNVEMFGPAG